MKRFPLKTVSPERLMSALFFMIFVLLTAPEGVAELHAPEFSFTHFTTDNVLPSNRVRDIVQDAEGFMWFATDSGLVRYDGTSARVFTPYGDSRKANEIFILSICRNGEGLLVGTDQNLYRYDPVKERMELLPLEYSEGVKGKVEGAVIDVCVDSRATIWVSVESKGVFRISEKGKVEAEYAFPECGDFVGMLYSDDHGMLWMVSSSGRGGVFRYDSDKGRFEHFGIKIDGEPVSLGALAITTDGHGAYWLGTWEGGLVKFNGRTGEGVAMGPDSSELWHIHSMTLYSPTALLVGSDSGLVLVDTETGEWKSYEADELNPDSLNDRFVYPVTIDSDGGLWVGTFYRGVNYRSRNTQRFRKWRHSRFANSVSGNVVTRVCEDAAGNIWVGTADGGLCSYDPGSGLFRKYNLSDSRKNDNINAICPDGGRLWVGTYSKGVGILDPESGKWTRIHLEGGDETSCYAICKDSRGEIWIGATQTFARYNPERNVFGKVSMLTGWISDIDEDRDGSLWVSTQGGGLCNYNPSTGKWRSYLSDGKPGSLPHNHVNSVKVDGDGRVYVSTAYGVSLYDRDSDSFRKIDTGDGSPGAATVERAGDDLWIGTSSGLLFLDPDGRTHIYTTSDGISDNQFVPGASLCASDGKLYYGTVNGLCMVDPLEARTLSGPPQVRFTGLDIINTPVEVGDAHLPKSLNRLDKLQLTHADHTFSVYFSSLDYSNPKGSSYRYRLEGFDKTWIEAGKENRATYSNLPPGSYTLRVKSAGSDGVWSDGDAALRIEVEPAWYASLPMKALYVIIGMALLLSAVGYIVKRMERAHMKEIDRISSNKEKEMFRSKLNFFTVIAHEIRTPVSLIIGPLEKVLESKERFSVGVKEDLKVIDRNARRLLSLVNQLLDFRKVEGDEPPVGFRTTDVTALVESVVGRFRPSVEHHGGRLTLVCPDGSIEADVDPEGLTKLVSNLLNNARKFTKDEIDVECRLAPGGKDFIVSVADNGIGISKENRDKVFKPFFQVLDNINESKGGTGLGLSIVKSMADAHGGKVELESAPGKGARFTVTLPLHQENVLPADMAPVDGGGTESEGAEVAAESAARERRPVLLVVDDNEEMLRFIASQFEGNYDVVTACNGKEALGRMKERQVSLIICDWMMPVMDGVEFLKLVRGNENFSHIPFVMLTAKTDNVSKITGMRSGADAYVEKPFSIGFLEARVANLLEMRKMLRDKFSKSPLEPMEELAPTPLDNELLTRLRKLIEDNLSNPDLNVDFLVEHMGMGRSSLYSKIRTLADVSPNELIQLTRLKKAAELLKDGTRRVNEVSYMVGFSSTSYFSRCFHKQFGMKPNEFQAGHPSGPEPGSASESSDDDSSYALG